MPAITSVLVAISKILLSETLQLMQHAAMPSSFKLRYGQASVVVMSQKTLFDIALALMTNMKVKVTTTVEAVATNMKTKDKQAHEHKKRATLLQNGYRGETLN